MAYERSTAFKTSLPPETWRIVLHSVGTQPHDLVELWTGCRGVSKFFKHEVEELFIADYLPRTTLSFAVTTSQGFDRHSRIEFHDHNLQMEYSRVSVDRNRAFFRAQYCDYARNSEIMSLAQEEEDEYDNDEFTKLFQKKHDSNSEATAKLHQQVCRSAPHHLVDFWRPSGNAALPKVFFHANGEVEVGWRELFAAVLAEEKYYYEAGWTPIDFQKHKGNVITTSVEYPGDPKGNAGISFTEKRRSASMFEQPLKEAETCESNMSKAKEAEAPHARVFHLVISRLWPDQQTDFLAPLKKP